jgi:hypothetical protein
MPMKKILFSLFVLLSCPVWSQNPERNKVIKIETGNSCLTLAVGADNYLYQLDYVMNAGFTPVCKKELESMIIGLNLE